MMPTLKISSEQNGKRLDVVLAMAYPDYSRAFMQKVVKGGGVRLKGQVTVPSYRVHVGEVFDISLEQPVALQEDRSSVPEISSRSLPGRRVKVREIDAPTILFEDKDLLVIDKPPNLVVHPAPGHRGDTLVDWLQDHLGSKGIQAFPDQNRLGLVHRLDKDTSGVLLIAKNVIAQTALGRQFHDRTVKKTYIAFIEGVPSAMEGIIDAPVGRSRQEPSRMAVSGTGRPSETRFEVAARWKNASLVTVRPKTGRTHQIRVHMAAIGHPVIGDLTYGSSATWKGDYGVERTLLHAERLEVTHPTTKKKMQFKAPWPEDFNAMKKRLGKSIALGVLGCFLSTIRLSAEQTASTTTAAPKAHASTGGSNSASATRALRKEMSGIKEEFESLKQDVSNLQQQIDGINNALNELGIGRRLKDLEKALIDINGKATGVSASAEEAKTQALDLGRRVKTQQDALDQLRDLVDRLQRQVIQQRTQQENSAVSEPNEKAGGRP